MRVSYDVVIIGYGPVGQTLAILLAQRGWTVGVVEKQAAPYPLPRAVHFDDEVARILQAAGVIDDILPSTEAADAYEWRNAKGEILLRFESAGAGRSGWPRGNMFAQPDLERFLDQRARAWPNVDVQRGREALAIAATADGVRIEVASPDGGREGVDARFVVGCDGANSFVRQYLGATVTDLGFFFDWLIIDVVPQRPTLWQPLNIQICDPLRPTTLVSGGLGRRRWEFMRLPGESLEELNNIDTAWRLLAPWDVNPDNAQLERHTVYRFQARWVDTWHRGRLLLAGDAAHQMPPFAGQGMCSGLRDAANLAWKLDLVLAAKAPPELLDTYASERVPHVAAMIHFSMALGRVICIADAAEAAARDAAMSASTRAGEPASEPPAPSIGSGVSLAGDAFAGQLFVQGRVACNGKIGLFDDIIGRGWILLSRSADPGGGLDAETAAFFASIGGTTVQVGAKGPCQDIDGTYERWFNDAGVGVVLQRPDFYIFGTAPRCEDATALVRQLREMLAEK